MRTTRIFQEGGWDGSSIAGSTPALRDKTENLTSIVFRVETRKKHTHLPDNIVVQGLPSQNFTQRERAFGNVPN